MAGEELAELCGSCGLCCDGTLFDRVMFDRGEVPPKKRVRLIADGRGLEQPCAALERDGACAVYDERPAACRRFVCRLLDRHSREGGPLEPRVASVRRTRELLGRVDELTGDESVELARRFEEDFARVVTT